MMMLLRKSVLVLGMVVFTSGLFAQTIEDAGAKYNEANQQYKARNFGSAVQLYEKALEMCNNLGGSAADLQMNVTNQLTNAYFRNGLTLYKRKKFDESIAQLEKTKAFANKTGNSSMEKKAVIYIARVYSTKGSIFIKEKNFDGAFAEFEKALKVNPDCINAFLGKAYAYKEKGDMNQMMTNVDKVIELGKSNVRATKKVAKAKRLAYLTLKSNGAAELQKEHASKALTYLTEAQKYGKADADMFYYSALAGIKLNKWDEAIASANSALKIKSGDKSGIYFALGQAYVGNKENANACKAFKKVLKGPNVAAAKYQMKQVLKCK